MNDTSAVAPLTRVTLQVEAATGAPGSSPSSDPLTFSFICGLAIEGLTGFERAIMGLSPGERTRLHIDAANESSFFEHLKNPLLKAVETAPPFELFIEVMSVEPVSERELIKALAEKTESGVLDCGCGCSCGCG